MKLITYFTEPFKKYDGHWKGTIHYEKMANRGYKFKFIGACVLIFILVFLLVKYYLKTI